MAKCLDLQVSSQSKEQLSRFHTFYHQKAVKDRKITLRDQGLGLNSIAVLNKLLHKTSFCSLDLQANQLGNEGIKLLCKQLQTNTSLMHLNLCSCEITGPGFVTLFTCLQQQVSVVDLNIGNQSFSNRNHLNRDACDALAQMMAQN